MNLQEILVSCGSGLIILVVLFISRWMARRTSTLESKLFTVLIIIDACALIFETLSFVIDGYAQYRVINILANSFLYACTATVSLVWIIYADLYLNRSTRTIKPYHYVFIGVWALLVLSLIPNAFLGFYFSIDANNVYSRELAGYVFYAFLFISLISSVVLYIRSRIRHGETQFFPIWMFLSPIVIACVVQAVWYGIAAAWLGCAIGLVGIHVNMQSKLAFIDPLTNIYNRAYLEHRLVIAKSKSNYVYGGIMFDVDYFKEINDSYGHSVGDKALIDVANILIAASERNSVVCRFAGDEFIILVRAPINNPEELDKKISSIKERVRSGSEQFNKNSGNPYKIIFSMGHAYYDKNIDEDIFFRDMDIAMYNEKQIHHKNHQNKE